MPLNGNSTPMLRNKEGFWHVLQCARLPLQSRAAKDPFYKCKRMHTKLVLVCLYVCVCPQDSSSERRNQSRVIEKILGGIVPLPLTSAFTGEIMGLGFDHTHTSMHHRWSALFAQLDKWEVTAAGISSHQPKHKTQQIKYTYGKQREGNNNNGAMSSRYFLLFYNHICMYFLFAIHSHLSRSLPPPPTLHSLRQRGPHGPRLIHTPLPLRIHLLPLQILLGLASLLSHYLFLLLFLFCQTLVTFPFVGERSFALGCFPCGFFCEGV